MVQKCVNNRAESKITPAYEFTCLDYIQETVNHSVDMDLFMYARLLSCGRKLYFALFSISPRVYSSCLWYSLFAITFVGHFDILCFKVLECEPVVVGFFCCCFFALVVVLACGGTWRCEHTLFCVGIVKRQILFSFIHSLTAYACQRISWIIYFMPMTVIC